jgi:hypothetical protein
MKELALIMAKVMPREDLVKMIMDEGQNYAIDPSDETWSRFQALCMIAVTKGVTDKEPDIFKTMADMDRVEKAARLYEEPLKG